MASLSGETVGVYPEAQKIAIQKMLGIYEPPWELIKDITLTDRESIDISVDSNGNPFELLQALIAILYPADLVSESSGYGRYYSYDADNNFVTAETGCYITSTAPSYKMIFFGTKANMRFANYTRQQTTGNYGNWSVKVLNVGLKFNHGNIVSIKMNDVDFEPAGTRIVVYGQRAY